MIDPQLQSRLEPLARRHRAWQLARALALCWSLGALAALALLSVQKFSGSGWNWAWTIPAALAAFAALWLARKIYAAPTDYRWIARQIEERNPELHAVLLTAIEQSAADGQLLGYLQRRVIHEALDKADTQNWAGLLPRSRVFTAHVIQFGALALFIAMLGSLPVAHRRAVAERAIQAGISVTPGDASVERGDSLVVLARFTGPLPAGVNLVIGPSADSARRVPLVKSLDDPVFGGSVPEVAEDFVYHLEYGRLKTRDFKVSVFEHPKLERSDVRLEFPAYTGQPEKRIEDTRRVTAVEGTKLELSLQLNKPVASARLVAKDKSAKNSIPLKVEAGKATAELKEFPLKASQTYELQIVDADGRTNKSPAQFVFDVLKNRAPDLKVVAPRGDQRVSALQEIHFQGEAWDDFGLRAYGIAYAPAGQPTKFIELGKDSPAKDKRPLEFMLKLEELNAMPDQLISYYLWAEDIGADGKSRRTSSDMFFAEVRPFEEIYRQSQAPESEGGEPKQQGNETMKLAELQKQIISATWKLQRRETDEQVSPQYKKDAPVVVESQEKALEQAQELKEKATNPKTQASIAMVEKEMETALKHLNAATNSPAPLPSALAAEQSAYQALLKLAAREYSVQQQRRNSKGKGGGEQRNQKQMDQLELKMTENRYEQQKQAAPQQSAEQKEQLQVFNRLQELARRQQDVNERLKELQTALQEAKTETEREEIRRRLKRLREEEQEMLADVDELRQRMDKQENQQKMADARKQLDQTRDEIQKAQQAMEQGSPAQALASGTRAQRELQEMRDEFRKKSSNQFSEEMKQLRSEARELAQKQDEIGKALDSKNDQRRKSLSEPDDKKALAEQLDAQRQRMTNLLTQATEVTERAETAEPLLHKQLYDTLRKNSQAEAKNLKDTTDELLKTGRLTRSTYEMLKRATEEGNGKSLEITAEMLRGGNTAEAKALEQRARRSIADLKTGVERAAESVLGDETESLKRARREIDALTEQLEREMAQAEGRKPGESGEPSSPGEQANSESKDGKQAGSKSSSQKSGDSKSAQAKADSQRSGKGQPGGKADGKGDGKESANQMAQNGQKQSGKDGKGGQGGKGGKGSPSQQPSASEQTAQSGQGQQPGQPSESGQGGRQAGARDMNQRDGSGVGGERGGDLSGRFKELLGGYGGGGGNWWNFGEDFVQWSDRLRDVEEMVDQPDLRNEIARVREQARAFRNEGRKKGEKPDWTVVKLKIIQPLAEVRQRLGEELARRESKDSLVPLDRDPVPGKYSELVRRYYEQLGSEK